MSMIGVMEVKIACVNSFFLVDTKIWTICWSFISYGDEVISARNSGEIKDLIQN